MAIDKQLANIIEQDYQVPEGFTPIEAVKFVIAQLRSLDPKVRDEYGYAILDQWLNENIIITDEEYRQLVDNILHEKAMHGNPATTLFEKYEAVFSKKNGNKELIIACQKSFIILLFCIILQAQQKREILTPEEVQGIFIQALKFAEKESDARSFDPVVGWIHIYAHYADLCGLLYASSHINHKQAEALTLELLSMIGRADNVFTGADGDRIAHAFMHAIVAEKLQLVDLFRMIEEEMLEQKSTEGYSFGFLNLRQVLRATILQLQIAGIETRPHWEEVEKKTNGLLMKK